METLFSPLWHRVASLRPRLKAQVRLHRHRYRGQLWYVLQNQAAGFFHRFSPSAYAIIGLMDGRRSVQEIWDLALGRLGDDAPTQDELIQLLSQLHAADALQCDVSPDTTELFQHREQQQRQAWQRRVFSVFAWQVPLFDPERLLDRLRLLLRLVAGWPAVALWLAVVGLGVVLAAAHWAELSQDVLDRLLLPETLLILWLLFPLIKLLHEFGHAVAVKAFGGEVHEMGLMLLVLTPVPYVDASASWAFPSKWQRIIVGGAGMAVELFVAALALFIWLSAEPGLIHALAYDTIMIAGISTIFFNANPLLKFDGYYMLMDWLEIPNLRGRANGYLGYLCERYLFGHREAEAPDVSARERVWFVIYALSSFVYRILVILAILIYLGEQSLLLGLFFAGMTGLTWLLGPAGKALGYLIASPRLRQVRVRAILTSTVAMAALVGALCLVPVPFRTMAEGVIWIPEEAVVRANADGFVEAVVAKPGVRVRRGELLVQCHDPELAAEIAKLEFQFEELDARYREQLPESRVKAEMILEERRYVTEKLARARERAGELSIRSRADGTFVLPRAADLPGRFIRKGERLAHVVDLETITIRTVVGQDAIALVRHLTEGVEVRLAERPDQALPASLTRVGPAASDQLPSPALGSQGGGRLALDPRDPEGRKAIQKVFQVELQLPANQGVLNVGGRVYIRFDHGWAPLAQQWSRRARQLFLSRLNV